MRRSLSFALASLVLVSLSQPGRADHASRSYAAWKWERDIVPNAASPAAEQCAVLDGNLFAGAAPGLRDVRLLQDGREVAYAIDESLDEHTGSDSDRSIYDTVAATDFTSSATGSRVIAHAEDRTATVFLPPRVPVERLRLIIADTAHRPDLMPHAMKVIIIARPQAADHLLREPEVVALQAEPERLLLPVTLGANLQDPAGVTVHVDPAPASLTRVALEMRRREICYQPLSSSPVKLLFGNAKALPVHYEFARYFQPKATPLLSSMGPIRANPAYRAGTLRSAGLSARMKLILEVFACAFALLLTLRPLLRAKR